MTPATVDYYKLLGIARSAEQDEIKRAFRTAAKKYHPDHADGSERSAAKFKLVAEAYHVLSHVSRRREYDAALSGASTAGNGWSTQGPASAGGAASGSANASGESREFNEFFNRVFRQFSSPSSDASGTHRKRRRERTPGLETELVISMEEAQRGCKKKIQVTIAEKELLGHTKTTPRTYDIRIPAGIRDGQKIRLRGDDAKTEDILIRIRIAAHRNFVIEEGDLVGELKVSPWEAALGERVRVETLDGAVDIKLPPGVKPGAKLRLKGYGMPDGNGEKGDLYYRVKICVPETLTPEERSLFERLRDHSRFNPRL